MAIYDLGTASLAANGEVTGVGTTWKAPLTLIRVGATIVFKTEPVQIYTISEIISDTQINVYNPNSETVPAGTGYAILSHDGITVQGLAQDVAETLRYYQSRETEVSTAVDIFKDFDQDKFSNDVSQVNTQFGEIVTIGAQVSADSVQVTADKNSAAASAASASSDKDAAAASAQEAADYAASLDATNLLRKDLNFSDVANKPLARDNLELGSVATFDTVPVANGGTGASSASDARDNLGLGSVATRNVGTSGDNVPLLSGANTWPNAQTFITPLSIESGGTGVSERDAIWPAIRPLNVLGTAGRFFGLPAGTTRNHIWMWNQPGTPSAGFANYIEGGWFDSLWRMGGIRSTNAQLSHVQLTVDSKPGPAADFNFYPNGTAQATNWSSTSDPRVKSLIEVIPDPLYLMRGIRGYSWYYEHTGSKGFGFLSSEVKVNFSGAVKTFGDATLPDGTVVHDVEGVDTSGVSAALHHEAILALMDKIEVLESRLASLEGLVKSSPTS